jgi:hypothetical protein
MISTIGLVKIPARFVITFFELISFAGGLANELEYLLVSFQ